jgi:RES domain-containing protein
LARAISDHPDFDHLQRRVAIAMARSISIRTVAFRSSEPTYATETDLLTGKGGRDNGGRWNPPSSFATVYTSLTDTTALAEAKANYLYYGLDPADALPRTIVAIDVKLAKVLDFTDGNLRRIMGISAARMRKDDWRALNRRSAESLTQAVGRAAYETGAEALIVPACDAKKNLVWFPGNLLTASKAKVRNLDNLR